MNKILCIGDAHVSTESDLSRFDYANELIMEKRPDIIVLMGDFVTLNCLSFWDQNKRMKMEGRRYEEEIDNANRALDKLFHGLYKEKQRSRRNKKAIYSPKIVYLQGNHEERLDRYLDIDPTFAGQISIQKDLKLFERVIQWIDYRDYFNFNGIGFTHIPHNAVRPVSGKYHIHKAMECTIKSVVYGHTHKLETACRHTPGMEHLQQVLSVGGYFDQDEEYVEGMLTHYWKGLVMLNNYKEGRFDVETYALGRLRRMYG